MIHVFFKKIKWCVWQVGFVGLIGFIFFPAYSDAATLQRPPNNLGLVGYWTFNEGTSTRAIDQSGNGNHGDITGSVWTTGKFSKALSFDGTGNQLVTIPHSTTMSPTDAVTVSAWVYITESTNRGILEKTISGAVNRQFLLFTEGGRFQFRVVKTTYYTVASDENVPLNTWVHVVGTYDGATVRIYINGVLQAATQSIAGPLDGGSGVTVIGSLGSSAYRMNGKIDEVRLYNRALSQSDVSALYRSGQLTMRKVTQQNLLGYWALNERFPSVRVADSSGNANTGIVRNSANSWSVGARGGGVVLDGNNDYIEVTNTTALEYAGGDLSIAFWMKPASDEADGGNVISKPWSGCGDYNYNVAYGSGQGLGFSLKGATYAGLNSASIAPRDRWSHVVATVDSSKAMKIYLNGVLDNSGTHSITDWTPPGCGDQNTPLALGTLYPYGEGWAGLTGFSFKGVLDDVRMYSRILSAAEVATMYRQNETTINASQNSRITNGLVGLWSFNGPDYDSASTTAEVLDRSGSGNNGNVIGASRVIGKVGQAMKFLGNNSGTYIDLGSSSVLNPSNFTISAWVKPRDASSAYGYIYSNARDCCSTYKGIELFIGYNRLYTQIWNSTAAAISSNAIIANNPGWVFVTSSYDGVTLKLYINGVLDNSTATALGVGSPASFNTAIGGMGMAPGTYTMDGDVDEVRLYNRALSAAEIKQLYNMGK